MHSQLPPQKKYTFLGRDRDGASVVLLKGQLIAPDIDPTAEQAYLTELCEDLLLKGTETLVMVYDRTNMNHSLFNKRLLATMLKMIKTTRKFYSVWIKRLHLVKPTLMLKAALAAVRALLQKDMPETRTHENLGEALREMGLAEAAL